MNAFSRLLGPLSLLAAIDLSSLPVIAQESPYFVTYDHHMEEPGNLEISFSPVFGDPGNGARSVASSIELEYGTRAWWTTSLYLNGQSTAGDSSVFTGYRFENRVRLLMDEHWINPVLYIEYADGNGADKTLKEVVGFDSWRDLVTPNARSRREKKREIETKLILSRNDRGWNYAGNLISEKNLAEEAWEFGYALGTSRPLALAASPDECRLCAENFTAGLELYGGLGESHERTLSNTSHYLAPTVAWSLPGGMTLRFSPAIGLTSNSNRTLVRASVSYELPVFRRGTN
jgi:hypothetical protein